MNHNRSMGLRRARLAGTAFALLAGLLVTGCRSFTADQTLLPGYTPMPNPVEGSGPGGSRPARLATGNFRDASIHVGQVTAPQMLATAPGATILAITQLSSLPAVSILRAHPADYDMQKHRLVPFEGSSEGCRSTLTLPIPIRGRGGFRDIVPVQFGFGLKSFYDDLSEEMARHHIVGLFDSRLDREETLILFGIFGRHCYRFHAIGVQAIN